MDEVLVNGVRSTCIAPSDRGLQYGDGLFETMRVHDGTIPLWTRHWRRLADGCRRLGLEGVEEAVLREETHRLAAVVARGIVKLVITRGSGGRGYRPPLEARPTRIVAAHASPHHPASHWRQGVALRLCRIRLGRNPALAGMKHLNRLEQVLARHEWDDPAIAEALMQDDRGRVVCGTMTNLFTVTGGRLVTPPVDECGVAGVMRALLLEWTGAQVHALNLEDLAAAEELLLCNAVIGIWPVRAVERQEYPIGKITLGLMERLRQAGLSGEV